MQIVSKGDNLHNGTDPVSMKNKKNLISLLSAEFAHSMIIIKHNLVTKLLKRLFPKYHYNKLVKNFSRPHFEIFSFCSFFHSFKKQLTICKNCHFIQHLNLFSGTKK